jgi:hypothetical protein
MGEPRLSSLSSDGIPRRLVVLFPHSHNLLEQVWSSAPERESPQVTLPPRLTFHSTREMPSAFAPDDGNQLDPDIRVRMDPAVMTMGRDQQIEAAVRELMGG